MHRFTRLAAVGLAILILASGIGSAVGPATQTDTEPTTDHPLEGPQTVIDRPADRDQAEFAPHARDVDRGPHAVADELGLTDEQRATVQATIEEHRENGASREAIRRAVLADLESFGHDREDVRQAHRDTRVSARMAAHLDLTQEQADVVVDDVHELRAAGATWSEIEVALTDRLESFGLNDAEIHHALWHVEQAFEHHRMHKVLALQDRFDLTDEQMDEVTETIRELRADGASPGEIREAVRDLLASYGVEFDGAGIDRRPTPERPFDGDAPADDVDGAPTHPPA